jgi:acyl-CoA synthetase
LSTLGSNKSTSTSSSDAGSASAEGARFIESVRLRRVPAELAERYVAEGWWSDQSLGDQLAEGLSAMGQAPFVVHSAVRPWRGTVGQVDEAARRFAGWLRANGIGPGDPVVFQLPNWFEAAVVFWGAAYVGAIVVPVVHFYGAKELSYITEVTRPAVVITPDRFGTIDHLAIHAEHLGRLGAPWAVVGDTPADELPAGAFAFDEVLSAEPVEGPADVDPDAPALVAFTSGTTRDPKGVIHSHRSIGFEARQLSAMTPTGGPPPITGAPVGHFIGMLNAFLCSLVREDPIHLLDVWDPSVVLGLMLDEGLGVSGGATFFVTSLLDHPDFRDEHLAFMPFAGMGGSPVPIAIAQRLSDLGIKVFRSYGSTEHPSITGCHTDEPEPKRVATDGRALEGVEVRLDDDGQILSRGPELFLGYTDPELTQSVFDDEGWYHTGDVGRFDDDGYLAITDRISDVIIRGGENISAQEVEELLVAMDGVAEVAVVAEPDDRLGERAVALVRSLPGQDAPTLDQVRQHLAAAGLAKQKWPESIRSVSDFPRTASGKVQKFRLRQQLREGTLDAEQVGQP